MIRLSRPSMWGYTFLSLILGMVCGLIRYLIIQKTHGLGVAFLLNDVRSDISSNPFSVGLLLLLLFYFLFPANLLIYGVNDIFDYETDKHNNFKKDSQKVLEPKNFPFARRAILFWNIPVLFAVVFVWGKVNPDVVGQVVGLLALFMFFAIFYSAPPIRAKGIPFIDGLFKMLYMVPGVIGYIRMYGSMETLSTVALIAGLCYVLATHAFAAIPDIKADRDAGIKTIATVLGADRTLTYCAGLYFLTILLLYPLLGALSIGLGLVYILYVCVALVMKDKSKLFDYFPRLNTLMLIVLIVVLVRAILVA